MIIVNFACFSVREDFVPVKKESSRRSAQKWIIRWFHARGAYLLEAFAGLGIVDVLKRMS